MTAPPEDRVTVGISTRDRPESLLRAVRSLDLLGPLVDRVVVVDDGSRTPVEARLRGALGEEAARRLVVLRREESAGPSAARNAVAEAARTPWLLYLDDDALIVTERAVREALEVLRADAAVAAVAFAQADGAGRPWPAGAQPAPVGYPCYVPAFIGFAALLRRDALRAVGGFREALGINGEEKELCLRLLDRGLRVVYLPDAPVGHLADPAGRDPRAYLHQTVRNNCLMAVYDHPLPVAAALVPLRLALYFRMRRGWGVEDPGGFPRLVRRIAGDLPAAWRARRPVRWRTLRLWRRMVKSPPPYAPPGAEGGG